MKYQLKDIISEYTEKNTNGEYEPVAVGKYGIRKRSDIYKKELAKDYSKNKVIRKNTMIVGMGSTQIDIGVLSSDDIYSVSPAYHTFSINSSIIRSEYLDYLFQAKNSLYTSRYMIASARQGKTVNLKDMLFETVDIPDFDVQQKTVEKINEIKDCISLEEKQLALYDELIKSRFIEMFGDPKTQEKETGTVEISTVCMLKAGKFVKAADIKDTCKDGMYPCYGANGFRGYVKSFNHDGIYNLIGRQGALCGNVTLVSGKFHATEHAVVVTPLQKLDPYWLYYFLMLLDINRYATGAAQPGLAVSTIEKILVKIPDLGLQEAFGNFFKTIDKSKFIVQKRIDTYKELLAKKMDEYFN